MKPISIGLMLKEARAQLGWTLTIAAGELHIDKSTLSRLENHHGYALRLTPLKLIQIFTTYRRSFISSICCNCHGRRLIHPGGTIVLVDDERTQLLIYQALLRRHFASIDVIAFNDSRAALKWLHDNKARLIITDYRMPNINGGELLSRIDRIELNRYTPAVLMTAKNETEIIRKIAKQENAVFYYKRQRKFALIRLMRDLLRIA